MKKLFLLSLVLMFIAIVSFASNPCIVDSTLVADGVNVFNTIQSAINSWCAGGTNAGQTPPFVINVVPVAPYAEHIDLKDVNVGTGDIVGDLTIQSSVSGTYAEIKIQAGTVPVETTGVTIWQSTENVTFRDIMFYPDLVTNPITSNWVYIDENAASAANTIAFYHCLWTNVDAGGLPLVTSRSQIYTAGYPAVFGNQVGRQVHYWPDPGEIVNLTLDDCCFYGCWSYELYARPTDGDTVTINNCCFGPSDYHQFYFRSDAGVVTGPVINITGTDQKAGPDNCTVFLQQWAGDNHQLYYGYGQNLCQLNISHCIFDVYGPQRSAVGTPTRTFSGSATWLTNISDTIIQNEGTGVIAVEGAPNPQTWERVTFNQVGASMFYLVAGTATGSITCRDCIFSGAGTTVWTGTVPTLGIDVDYCDYAQSGADAILSRGTGQTDGANVYPHDPLYLGADFTVANFFDVDSQAFAGKGTAASNLAGGADYVGNTGLHDWTMY